MATYAPNLTGLQEGEIVDLGSGGKYVVSPDGSFSPVAPQQPQGTIVPAVISPASTSEISTLQSQLEQEKSSAFPQSNSNLDYFRKSTGDPNAQLYSNTERDTGLRGISFEDATRADKPKTTELSTQYSNVFSGELDAIKSERAQAEKNKAELDAISGRLDSLTANFVQNIKNRYENIIKQQEDLNASVQAAVTKSGIRGGRSRYAAEEAMSEINVEVRNGLDRVKKLEDERDALILQAQTDNEKNKYDRLYKGMTMLQENREKSRKAVTDLFQTISSLETAAGARAKTVQDSLKSQQETSAKKAEIIAPYVNSFLTGNLEKDAALIGMIANAQGFDPAYLLGEVQKYSDTKNKNESTSDILNYNLYSSQEKSAGGEPISFDQWLTSDSNRRARASSGSKLDELLSPTEAQTLEVPYGTTRARAAGMGITPEKPATEAQKTLATYASRIEQADPTLRNLESDIKNMNLANFEAQIRLPAALQSSNIQQYMQAARNFINAVLRRESGAVISPSEFSEARQQYLPQPGDASIVLKQKEQNRRIVYESFKKGSGSAYAPLNELLGIDVPYGGKTYTFPSKEKADEFKKRLNIK